MSEVCNKDCFNCPYEDCILDDLDLEDYEELDKIDQNIMTSDVNDDWIAKKREYQKNYYQNNKARMLEKSKAWHEAHKAEMKAYKQAYYQAHKEEIKLKQRKYYEENRLQESQRKRKQYVERKKRQTEENRCLTTNVQSAEQ